MVPESPSSVTADDHDPRLAAAVRLVRRRRRWGWTTVAGFIWFLIVISVYSNKYNDATDSGPVAVLAVAMAVAALTIVGIVMVVATSVLLRRQAGAQRAQAISSAARLAGRRAGRFDWAIASGLLIVALGLAVLFLPGLVNGVSYVSGGHTAAFVPQSYGVSCSYHGTGDCSTVTVGVLRTRGGGVQSTWPDQVPLGRPFKVREPVWTWGLGAALLDGDGIAAGAAAISLLFDGLAVLAAIFFIKVIRRRLGQRRRADPAPGLS